MVGVITWLGLVLTDIFNLLSATNTLIKSDIPSWLPGFVLNLYILSLYYYYKFKIESDDVLNFVDLLWRVFATGLVATVFSLAIKLIEYLLGSTRIVNHVIFIDLVYLINLGLMVGFLIMAFTAWKRLILYQKSKWLLRLWNIFEWGLLISLLYNSFALPFVEGLYLVLMAIFILIGFVLSGNMKWVA